MRLSRIIERTPLRRVADLSILYGVLFLFFVFRVRPHLCFSYISRMRLFIMYVVEKFSGCGVMVIESAS